MVCSHLTQFVVDCLGSLLLTFLLGDGEVEGVGEVDVRNAVGILAVKHHYRHSILLIHHSSLLQLPLVSLSFSGSLCLFRLVTVRKFVRVLLYNLVLLE